MSTAHQPNHLSTALYIHIPFCKKKCDYCDFVSYAGKEEMLEEYVQALTQEIEASPPFIPLSIFDGEGETRREGVRTIFFGGGTPTLLEPKHFDKIISTIICHLSLDIGRSEISVECNPGTADKAKLKALHDLGINRLSIGAQSFNDRHLKTLGRIHDAKAIFRIYDDARSAGFDNINLDLMFALPSQTVEEWKADLQSAINLKPNHLSTYNLSIEENTPFNLRLTCLPAGTATHNLQLPDEDEELEMYEYTIETLIASGYKHYEISNFAKPGFECRHNINYWLNGNYIGVGAGAHSHINGQRWSNPNCIEEYIKSMFEVRSSRFKFSPGTPDQRETIFLGLRLPEGIPTNKFNSFEKEVSDLIKDGMLEEKNGNYRLTRKGLYLGNLVFEKFV